MKSTDKKPTISTLFPLSVLVKTILGSKNLLTIYIGIIVFSLLAVFSYYLGTKGVFEDPNTSSTTALIRKQSEDLNTHNNEIAGKLINIENQVNQLTTLTTALQSTIETQNQIIQLLITGKETTQGN